MRTPLLGFILFASTLSAQQRSTGDATSRGNCSPAITGDKNTIKVTCTDERTQQAIFNLLKNIHDSQLPTKTILSKLDEILKVLDANGPRHFTPYDEQAYLAELKPLSGSTVVIFCDPVGEACEFAQKFADLFHKAGWKNWKNPIFGATADSNVKDGTIRIVRKAEVTDFRGVKIVLDPLLVKQEPGPQALARFTKALVDSHVVTQDIVVTSGPGGNYEPGIGIFVGERP